LDALSDVLRVLRLTGGVFLDARFTAPWCVRSRAEQEDWRPFMAQPAQVIAYHYVVSGRVVVKVDGEDAVTVSGGELVLLPRNDEHLLGSALDLPIIDGDRLTAVRDASGFVQLRYGGDGEPAHIVCGFIGLESARHPLIDALPSVLKLSVTVNPAREWISSSFRYAAQEVATGRTGSGTVLSKLSELLFVEAIRGYVETLPRERTGWLAGLRDPVVSRALSAIHSRLAHPWTADDLAKEAFLSRSAFADRFTALIGMPPMRYLTLWRMQVAAQRLRETHASLAQVAAEVGYESEAAFARVFKRELGATPAAWRRGNT
jgi:AraC-like DNA-binding protein